VTVPQVAAGTIIGGKYRLVRYLAAGGMGTVYEAQHTVVKRRVALKLLHPELATKRDSLARFEREAQAAGSVESENVAAALDFGIAENGSPYLVLEYLAGESLRALLDRSGRLPLARATDIALQACRGVGAAHKAGIVHRDLNPQNIFVCRRDDGTDLVKVLDFGIAKLESSRSTETHTGTILGTPAYLAPEQARGEKNVDQRADVYGLGAVFYEMLAGEKPHPGDSHNATLHHICTQPALPLDGARLGLPPELVAVVMAALSSDPSGRPGSTEELVHELLPWAKREVWPAPPAELDGARASSAVQLERTGGPRARRPRWWLVLALAALVVGSAGAGIAFRAGKRPAVSMRRTFPHGARLFVPPPNPGAVDQIAALAKANAAREAAAITAMAAVPQAIWFSKGSPEEVQGAVSNVMVRAAQDGALRVLVANNRPYRDCTGFSAGGARDTAAYEAWIDAFARGIGNERAIVILEADSMGMIPYISTLEGVPDPCRPTITDASGKPVPAPQANPDEAFAQIRYAAASLARLAPNALVYLDGTHPGWLAVSDTAYRLYRSGVLQTQGFTVNVSNFQTTDKSIRYGAWVSKCLAYATTIAGDRGSPAAFRRCANQPSAYQPADVRAGEPEWAAVEAWYDKNVPDSGVDGLVHFVIDTSRNGRGPLDVARYAEPPYSQPESVIRGLASGAWCTPPGTGLGLRPTTETGVPLLDAYLWIKTVGESDGSCDINGGMRAWDYDRYNPWGIAGESQKHFDPLWGMIDPAAGTWFPAHALDLAEKAQPPLL
jgi:endoglucanase